MRSNVSVDITPDQRISDEDILNNINTFMFAGSDTSSLSVTWIFYLLAIYPAVQDRLRAELLTIAPSMPFESLAHDEIASLYEKIADLPYLEQSRQRARSRCKRKRAVLAPRPTTRVSTFSTSRHGMRLVYLLLAPLLLTFFLHARLRQHKFLPEPQSCGISLKWSG